MIISNDTLKYSFSNNTITVYGSSLPYNSIDSYLSITYLIYNTPVTITLPYDADTNQAQLSMDTTFQLDSFDGQFIEINLIRPNTSVEDLTVLNQPVIVQFSNQIIFILNS